MKAPLAMLVSAEGSELFQTLRWKPVGGCVNLPSIPEVQLPSFIVWLGLDWEGF